MPDNKYTIVPKLSLYDDNGNHIDVCVNGDGLPGLVDVLYFEPDKKAPNGQHEFARFTVERKQMYALIEVLKQAADDDRFWE